MLAANLAGYFANRGHSVMLGNADRQQSARNWLDLPPSELPGRPGRQPHRPDGMRVDARTRAAADLERFFAMLDLPPSRAERDLAQWRAIIHWMEAG